MILTEYEPTPWAITLMLKIVLIIILIIVGIYLTQEIDPGQSKNPDDTTETKSDLTKETLKIHLDQTNPDSLISLARNLSILTDKTEPTPLEIRTISCKTNIDKERNQITVKSDGTLNFIQQLKDLSD